MDIVKYRRYFIYGGDPYFLSGRPNLMVPIYLDVPYTNFNTLTNNTNHPLVNSKQAFWINNTTLVTGYCLKNDSNIVRPIYSHTRENYLENIRKELLKTQGEFIGEVRKKIVKDSLSWIKKLPLDITNHIANIAYGI